MSHKILVTGCTGFIARYLVPTLKHSLVHSTIIGTSRGELESGSDLDEHIVADLANAAEVRRLVQRTKPSAVFHLASQRSGDLNGCLATNVGGTANLLDALREEVGTHIRVVVVGSAAEIGFCEPRDLPVNEDAVPCPVDAYGIAKLAQSLWAQAQWRRFEQSVVRMRLFNLVGPEMPEALLLGRCARLLAEKVSSGCRSALEFGDLSTSRDYTDVRDVCRALILGLEKGTDGRLYHIGSGRAETGRALVQALIEGAKPSIEHIEFQETAGHSSVPIQVADASRAWRELGWRAEISLEESLSDLWQVALKSTEAKGAEAKGIQYAIT